MGVDFESSLAPFAAYRAGPPLQTRVNDSRIVDYGTKAGYLSGSFPDGVTTVDGVPVPATVRVLLRSTDPALDGLVMAEVQSMPSGTWLVNGLNPKFRYDVVGHKAGFNDVIMANVTPKIQ